MPAWEIALLSLALGLFCYVGAYILDSVLENIAPDAELVVKNSGDPINTFLFAVIFSPLGVTAFILAFKGLEEHVNR